MMNKARLFSAMITTIFTIPIWYYVLYQILSGIQASELTWFLFWVYIPFGLVAHFLSQIANGLGDE